MQKYYFTFGSDEKFPYQNGFIEVRAESYVDAVRVFRDNVPDRTKDVLNCSDVYDQEQWKKVLEHGHYRGEKPKAVFKSEYALKEERLSVLFANAIGMYAEEMLPREADSTRFWRKTLENLGTSVAELYELGIDVDDMMNVCY